VHAAAAQRATRPRAPTDARLPLPLASSAERHFTRSSQRLHRRQERSYRTMLDWRSSVPQSCLQR
jgi:hypothetical protein